jgi:hypothetical protein
MKLFNIRATFLYVFILISSACGNNRAVPDCSPVFRGIKIGDSIESATRIGFDYSNNLMKASTGTASSMQAILEIGERANFDGSAATAHREVLWELFLSQRQTFLDVYNALPHQRQEYVRSRIREALDNDFN